MAKKDEKRARYEGGKALARIVDAQLILRNEIEAAAERISDQIASGRGASAELGILDDVVDALDEVGRAAERVLDDVVDWLTEGTPDIIIEVTLTATPAILADMGEIGAIERTVEGKAKAGPASAEQLLAARQALLDARDVRRKRLHELVNELRASKRDAGS